jgi:hypothetical protein
MGNLAFSRRILDWDFGQEKREYLCGVPLLKSEAAKKKNERVTKIILTS